MTVLAAPGDTWGISGPEFLFLYFVAAIVLLFIAMLHRAFLFAGRHDLTPEQLGPQQAAYLSGRERLAIYSALGALRGAEAIAMAPDGTLTTLGPLPAGATPLDGAIYQAARRRVRPHDLSRDEWVVAALRQLREGLEAAHLVPTSDQRRAARYVPLVMVGLVALGLIRLVVGVTNGKAVGFLVPLLFLVAALAIGLLVAVLRRTRAANAALRALRSRHSYLAPASAPSYATYGASGVAMGIALWGGASLWALDPAFAEEAGIPRNIPSVSNGGSGDAGSSGDSGGGGCGGGGCGG